MNTTHTKATPARTNTWVVISKTQSIDDLIGQTFNPYGYTKDTEVTKQFEGCTYERPTWDAYYLNAGRVLVLLDRTMDQMGIVFESRTDFYAWRKSHMGMVPNPEGSGGQRGGPSVAKMGGSL